MESGAPYDVVAALTHELSARAPTVFVLEDLHWADEATLDVLRLLARRVETVPALVIASYRDDELDAAHPLRIVLGELATTQNVGRMKLVLLSPGAVAQLAEPYGVDADELYRKTGRQPVLRRRSARRGSRRDPGDGQGRSARPRRTPQPRREDAPRGGRRRAAAGRALAPGGARRRGSQRSRRVPDLRHAYVRASGRGVPARARPSRRRGIGRAAPTGRPASQRRSRRSPTPPSGALDLARLAHHAEAAGDVDAVLRFAPAAACRGGVSRRAPRGGGAVRTGAAIR